MKKTYYYLAGFDGVHPTGAGQRIIADTIKGYL